MGKNEFRDDRVLPGRVILAGFALLAAVLVRSVPATAQSHLASQEQGAWQEAVSPGHGLRLTTPAFSVSDLSGRETPRDSELRPETPGLFAFQDAAGSQTLAGKETKRRSRMALMQLLTEGDLPRLGSPNAPVTMVVFSDFECPFCRKLVNILDQQVLPADGKQVQIVYRNFPLTSHPWALTAAEEAGCAALQSNAAFWALHNKIFENQKTINKDNAQARIMELAKSVPGINFDAFQTCVKKQAALKNVLRDVSLGNMASIYATPTLFVNGWRLDGVGDASDLKEVIAYALQDSQAHPAGQGPGAKSPGASK